MSFTADVPGFFRNVRVVTTTLSKNPDDLRVALAIRTINAVKAMTGNPMIVIDGSPEPVKDLLRSAGADVVDEDPTNKTMGDSRRQAVYWGEMAGSDIIIWMEPEKYPLVPFLPQLVAPVMNGEFDLVIPRRRSLRSYPAYQMAKELEGNHEVASMTGRPDLDLWSGPRIMNRKAATLFTHYRGQFGDRWESIFIPVVETLSMGLRVGSVTVDYVHPPEQTAAESGPEFDQKRDVQLNVLVEAMRLATTTTHKIRGVS